MLVEVHSGLQPSCPIVHGADSALNSDCPIRQGPGGLRSQRCLSSAYQAWLPISCVSPPTRLEGGLWRASDPEKEIAQARVLCIGSTTLYSQNALLCAWSRSRGVSQLLTCGLCWPLQGELGLILWYQEDGAGVHFLFLPPVSEEIPLGP